MKKYLFLLLSSVLAMGADVQTYLDKDGTLHVTQEFVTPASVREKILREGFSPREEGPVDPVVVIDQIINLGSRIWKIIEANQPSVDVKYSYANALPKGVRSSEELNGFSDLQFRSVRHYGKNTYGMTVYDVTYTLTHRYGGKYDERGAYLENVTILPQHVEASWGYTLSMNVEKVGVVNSGTDRDPVASLAMEMALNVSTVMKKMQIKNLYQFRGDVARVSGSERKISIR